MGANLNYVHAISTQLSVNEIGRKSSALQKVVQAGFSIPQSFCLISRAYHDFLRQNDLYKQIAVELNRKAFQTMRWEELWDCALRIRNLIMKASMPDAIKKDLAQIINQERKIIKYAVRSSSPQEDMHSASFAGIYDSYINCQGIKALQFAIAKVWASLWSDRALLYRRELNLDPLQSSMAILLQEMIPSDYSGVAFSCNPNDIKQNDIMIEIVPGLCANLVDGSMEPDRFILKRDNFHLHSEQRLQSNRLVLTHITHQILANIAKQIYDLETLFQHPVDVEWTVAKGEFIVLQVRPISYKKDSDEKRNWYLTLTPQQTAFKRLRQEVEQDLIPKLRAEGRAMQQQEITDLADKQLANAIQQRLKILHKWRKIYIDKFIPFAHGVRLFAQYYNDLIKPDDPYEFIQLLKTQSRIAQNRLQSMKDISQLIHNAPTLKDILQHWLSSKKIKLDDDIIESIQQTENGQVFIKKYQQLKVNYFDISLDEQRWLQRDDVIIQILLQFTDASEITNNKLNNSKLLQAYYATTDDQKYAQHMLAIGRLSWQLRDDDNLLLGKIESQLLAALEVAKRRLVIEQRMPASQKIVESHAKKLTNALLNPQLNIKLTYPCEKTSATKSSLKARQLKGQPAVPGIATGIAIQIRTIDDIKAFKSGNIIICDAIDPNMTHIVPLAKAIVESRGGMLIHGVIIARELGIPCVNGIVDLMKQVSNGQMITVDGTQGLVIVGDADFNYEMHV